MGLVDDIRAESKRQGGNKKKIFYMRDGDKKMVRFLTDFDDGLKVKFHNSYELKVNCPCREEYGERCGLCGIEDERMKDTYRYVWSIYDHDSKAVELLVEAVSRCSPIPQLTAIYDDNGETLLNRDIVMRVSGKQIDKTYTCIPQDKKKFRGTEKPYSKSSVLKILDQAFPYEVPEEFSSDADDDEKYNRKGKKKDDDFEGMNEPEDGGDGWDEEEGPDYESMAAIDLWKECKKRKIDCQPRKSQKYYISLLEDDDKASDDWEDDEDGGLPFN